MVLLTARIGKLSDCQTHFPRDVNKMAAQKFEHEIKRHFYLELDKEKTKRSFMYYMNIYYRDKNDMKKKTLSKSAYKVLLSLLRKNADDDTLAARVPELGDDVKCELMQIGGEECVVKKRTNPSDPILKIVPIGDIFDAIFHYHEEFGHCFRSNILKALQSKYWVEDIFVDCFLRCCKVCKGKKKDRRPDVSTYNRKVKLDIIDMEHSPDGLFHYILVYIDVDTSFTLLRPLMRKCPIEVTLELLKNFLDFGAPACFILVDDENMELLIQATRHLEQLCTRCVINLASINKTKKHIAKLEYITAELKSWMATNNCDTWSIGCAVVQWKINSHVDNKMVLDFATGNYREVVRSPFSAVFKTSPTRVIQASSLVEAQLHTASGLSQMECSTNSSASDDEYENALDDDLEIREVKIEIDCSDEEMDTAVEQPIDDAGVCKTEFSSVKVEFEDETSPDYVVTPPENLGSIKVEYEEGTLNEEHMEGLVKEETAIEPKGKGKKTVMASAKECASPSTPDGSEWSERPTCHVCQCKMFKANSCTRCEKPVHIFCSTKDESVSTLGYVCSVCLRQ